MLTWIVGLSSCMIFGSVAWLCIKQSTIQKIPLGGRSKVRHFRIEEIGEEG